MPDQKINELITKTSPASGDKMLMVGTKEEYLVNYDEFPTALPVKDLSYVNDFDMTGVHHFIINSDTASGVGLPGTSWWYVEHMAKEDGYAVQHFYELYGEQREYKRCSSETGWIDDSLTDLNIHNPQIIFEGERVINDNSSIWVNENFNNYTKIEMIISFQNHIISILLHPTGNESSVYDFCFGTNNTEDNGHRIVICSIQFAGKYLTNISVFMSLNNGTFSAIAPSTITVKKIIGYK